jgi:hypothetical protein
MIEFFIFLWPVIGCAGVLHMHYVVRRDLHKVYGRRYPMDTPLFDAASIMLFMIGIIGGPLCFVTTLIAFPRSFLK